MSPSDSAIQATPAGSLSTLSSMRVLLRNSQTGLLYAGGDHWTREYSEAFEFEAVAPAIDCAAAMNLTGAEVVMWFSDSGFEIPLKLVGRGE